MNATLTRRAVVASGASLVAAGILSRVLPPTAVTARAGVAATGQPARFRIAVDEATLARIAERVRTARFPVTSADAGWTYGVDAAWFKDLVAYWRDTFDWRAAETKLNKTPQYLVSIDGKDVHFARVEPTGGGANRTPLLLLHGWPYSFATMLPLAEILANDGFEVIVPSLPGFHFSQAADDRVRGLRFISGGLGRLMTEVLGHDRYLVQGGDFGAVIGDWLSVDTPQHVLGLHTNLIALRHAGAGYGSGQTGVLDPTPDETAYARAEVENMERESAYFRLQATRPETLTYALTDSPVGWAAYMLDKWQKWSDTRKRPFEAIFDRDRLLTEVMLYLVTDTVASSIWPYAGFATESLSLAPGEMITAPFGYSSFPTALLPRIPRHFVERSRSDIRLWREHDWGGHFPMLERPQTLAADIRDFAAILG
jgi:pimeloyl-ACP methyl ester carboxylesterase